MMKKILLGTTAIVGVALVGQAMAAEKPKLSMSGNVKFEAQFVDEDDTAGLNRGYGFSTDDAEIVFRASTTADNGLEYGAKIEFTFEEGDDSDGDRGRTDEAMMYLEGNWGLLQLGNEDGVEDAMRLGGWSVIGGTGGHDGETFFANNASALISTAQEGDTSDATKITYYTPLISGFRAGVSFTPDGGHEYDNGETDDDGDLENNIAFGVEYKGDFDQVGVHVAGRYVTSEFESNDEGGTDAEKEEISSFGVGANVTYAGFAFGVGYVDNDDSGITKTNKALGIDAGSWVDVGASYSTGPYKVGIAYFHSEETVAQNQEAEADIFSVTADWNVAPGLDVYGEYVYADLDDGTTGTSNDNEASAFIVGTKISF